MSAVANMGGALPMGVVSVMVAGVAPPQRTTATSHDDGTAGKDVVAVTPSAATSSKATADHATAVEAPPVAKSAASDVATLPQASARTSTLATPTTPAASITTAVATPAHTTTAHTAKPATFGETPSAAGAVGGTVFALLFVLALILALAWLAKRMPGVAGASNSALRIVGSLSLGPRERVVVVDVGGTQLLLGVGAGGTRALHTLEAPLPAPERTQATPFAQLLAQHFGKKA